MRRLVPIGSLPPRRWAASATVKRVETSTPPVWGGGQRHRQTGRNVERARGAGGGKSDRRAASADAEVDKRSTTVKNLVDGIAGRPECEQHQTGRESSVMVSWPAGNLTNAPLMSDKCTANLP